MYYTSLTALFGSTYLCESAFSHVTIIKSKYRSTITDDHLEVWPTLPLIAVKYRDEILRETVRLLHWCSESWFLLVQDPAS